MRSPAELSKALVLLAVAGLAGCDNTKFSGTGKATAHPVVTAAPLPATNKPSVDPAPTGSGSGSETAPVSHPIAGCGEDGVTQAKLLTATLDLNDANAYLDYEVSRVDCDGVIQPFTADKILFDMDAYGMNDQINFAILGDSDAEVSTGILQRLDGSDLFGHTGTEWAHYETASAVQAQGSKPSVKLRVKMSGQALSPRVAPTTAPAADRPVPIPSYLRFGAALPVQVDVSVLHSTIVSPLGAGGVGASNPSLNPSGSPAGPVSGG